MSNYDDQPCSLAFPSRFANSHPKVIEDTSTPQKPAEEQETRKKSCLSAPNPRKEVPAHPALRQKTVAFGKTVNVSQTVEATSRAVKKAMNTASPMQAQNQNQNQTPTMTENKENREDLLKIIHDELAVTRREIQEENAKKQEELNEQNLKKMQEMMSSFFQQIAVAPKLAISEKENITPRPVNKITMIRQKIQKEGKIPPEALPILERRIQSDPLFRQTIDDVLADAEYESENGAPGARSSITQRYSPPPPVSTGYAPYTGGVNPSKLMRETLTVERSIRFDNGLESIDQRRKTTHWNGQDRYRDAYSPDPILQSTYQPGSSVSYYPSASAPKGRADDYYVDQVESDIEDYHPGERHQVMKPKGGSKEDRERRIREKYGRRN